MFVLLSHCAVYHLTDLPGFVSDRCLVMFDPQAKFLPDVNPSDPGKIIDFVAKPGIVKKYPDQFAPFCAFGCTFTAPFNVSVTRYSCCIFRCCVDVTVYLLASTVWSRLAWEDFF